MRLADRAIQIALAEAAKKVREVGGRNAGPDVEKYLATVGLKAGQPWCAAFVCWVYTTACIDLSRLYEFPRSGSVQRLWDRGERFRVTGDPLPGDIFIHLGKKKPDGTTPGHTGIILGPDVNAGSYRTCEANTGPAHDPKNPADRDGDGVYVKTRPAPYINVGYLRFDSASGVVGM